MIRPHTNPWLIIVDVDSSSSTSNGSNITMITPCSSTNNGGNGGNNNDSGSDRSFRYFNRYRASYYDDHDGNSSDNTHRHVTELPRPNEVHLPAPSDSPPAYTPPLTAQARARIRLSHSSSISSLRSATFSLSRSSSTAGMQGIRPPRYSLRNAPTNLHNAGAGVYETSGAPVVPAVAEPPSYAFHRRDRFLETNQAATYNPNSLQVPPPSYGVAPRIRLLGEMATAGGNIRNATESTTRTPVIGSYRTARSLRSLRGARSIDSIDGMIDLEQGDPPRNRAGVEVSGSRIKRVIKSRKLFLFCFIVLDVGLCALLWMANHHLDPSEVVV